MNAATGLIGLGPSHVSVCQAPTTLSEAARNYNENKIPNASGEKYFRCIKREPAAHSILSPHGMKVIVQRAPGRTETISISPFPAYRDKKKKSRDNPRLSISR